MDKTCYIFGAGEYSGSEFDFADNADKSRIIIAADAGFKHLKEHGIEPDLIVGDFDSLGYTPNYRNVIKCPVEKDYTDTGRAIDEGFRLGCSRFIIFGGLGGRIDHMLANIQALSSICLRDGSGYLIGNGTIITAFRDGFISFPPSLNGIISVFATDTAKSVTIRGLKYETDQVTLINSYPIGVSNEFTGNASSIEVRSGILTVVWQEKFTEFYDRFLHDLS